jgi:WD40 repeat protein
METEEPETSYDLSKYADRAVVWSRASIDVWDVIAGKQIATIKRNTRGAIGADISDDGSRIAIQSTDDGRVTVWDAGTGRRISTLDSTWPEIRNIRSGFNRNGSRILVKDNAGIVELFDSATGARIEQLHNRFQGIAEFTEDGERILLAGEDGQIALWNAMTGTLLAVLTDANLTYRLAFTSDSNFIVHGGPTPRIWDARSGRQIAELRGHSSDVTGVRFSRDNSRFLTIGRDGETLLWDVATATTLSKMVVPLGNREVFFAGNGQRIVIIGKGFQTTVFETATGRKTVVAPGNTAKMSGDFSPDETYLASVLAAKKVRVWESGNGAEITELQGHTDNINGVMFSPDGKTILTVSDDKTARLWESVSGRQVAVWEHPSEVVKGQFSPDGTHVVTISKSGARLWKVEDDGRGIDLSNEQRYDEIIFSPDGSVVLLISFGRKEMTEFDVKTGQSLALVTLTSGSGELVYYRNPFDNLIVSADHSMIGSQDNETVWPLPWSLQDYVDKVKAMLPRCLTPDERKAAYLDTEPPEWCVEMEKWPYNTDKWKAWLKDKTTAREELAASHPPPR